jgi:CRISPR/Cas system CSM-associated protein Csm2 small subunit
MALVVKKKTGQNTQQVINEFRRLTFEDPGLDKVKQVGMTGYQKPSRLKNVKMTELRKLYARIRRRNKRRAGKMK